MELQYDSRTSASQPRENAAEVNISLGMTSIGALDTRRLHEDLVSRREEIRREVFEAVSGTVVPGIAGNMGMPVEAPETWSVKSEGNIRSSLDTVDAPRARFVTDHDMDMKFVFETEQAMNAATMLQLGREQVAAMVADNYVHSLEQRYLGKERSSVDSEWSTAGNEITDYRAEERAPAALAENVPGKEERPLLEYGEREGDTGETGTAIGRPAESGENDAEERFSRGARETVRGAEECFRKYGCSIPDLEERAENTERAIPYAKERALEAHKNWRTAVEHDRQRDAHAWKDTLDSEIEQLAWLARDRDEMKEDLARWAAAF